MGGIGVWQLLVIALIVLVLFGTRRLRNLGSDLGTALKGFRTAVKDENDGASALDGPEQFVADGDASGAGTERSGNAPEEKPGGS